MDIPKQARSPPQHARCIITVLYSAFNTSHNVQYCFYMLLSFLSAISNRPVILLKALLVGYPVFFWSRMYNCMSEFEVTNIAPGCVVPGTLLLYQRMAADDTRDIYRILTFII